MLDHKIIAGIPESSSAYTHKLEMIFSALEVSAFEIYENQVTELLTQFNKHYNRSSSRAVVAILTRCLELQLQLLGEVPSDEEKELLKKVIEQKKKELWLVEQLHSFAEGLVPLTLQAIHGIDALIKGLAETAVGDNVRFYKKLQFDSFKDTFAEKLKNTQAWVELLKLMRNDSFFVKKGSIALLCKKIDTFFEDYTGHLFGLHAAFNDSLERLQGSENIIVSDVLKGSCKAANGGTLGTFDYYFQRLLKLLSPRVLTAY